MFDRIGSFADLAYPIKATIKDIHRLTIP